MLNLRLLRISEVKKLYEKSSLFVMPSKFEPWGKVFFEAMTHGLPVIGGDCCAMPEFIRNGYNGYTIGYSPEELAEKIISIFKNFSTYKKCPTMQ